MNMKINNIKIIAVVAVILSLAGCSNDGRMGADVDAGHITVDASIGPMTKVAYNGNATEFSVGDQIAVYGWTGSADAVSSKLAVNGVCNTLGTDGTWTPATQMLWKNSTDAHYFVGVYPAKDITDFTADAYSLDPSPEAYTASDLLIAANLSGVKAAGGPVKLKFDHAMAKLNVNIRFGNEFAVTPTISSVKVIARKNATVNYLTKSVTATGQVDSIGIPAAATVATGYAYSYSGLQIPQDGVTTIIVTIADKEFVYNSTTDIALQSGQYTTLGFIIGKDRLEVASVNVSDWTTAPDLSGGVALQRFINGHECVDMGLSVKWGTCNVGATDPTDYGDYFAWGETEPHYESLDPLRWKFGVKAGYDWCDYQYCKGSNKTLTKYCNKSDYGTVDNKTTLESEDDAAHAKWGGSWRTPTEEEWNELKVGCTIVWKTIQDGYAHPGYLVTSIKNGNSIFLPAAGYLLIFTQYEVNSNGIYWSSSIATTPNEAIIFNLDSNKKASNGPNRRAGFGPFSPIDSKYRNYGLPVRPVCP